MILQYFVTEAATDEKIPVEIDKSTSADLETTKTDWQTDWTSEFIGDPSLEKYTAKTEGVDLMDIEVKRMSPTAIEMLDQLSIVCKRFGIDYYASSQNQRDLLDSIALHEYQLKKAHEQGLKRSEVPPFLGLKRSDRSNDMPA